MPSVQSTNLTRSVAAVHCRRAHCCRLVPCAAPQLPSTAAPMPLPSHSAVFATVGCRCLCCSRHRRTFVATASLPPPLLMPSRPVIEQYPLCCCHPLLSPSLQLPPHCRRFLSPQATVQIPRKPATAISRCRCQCCWLPPPPSLPQPSHCRRLCLSAAAIPATLSADSPSNACSALAALCLYHCCRCRQFHCRCCHSSPATVDMLPSDLA